MAEIELKRCPFCGAKDELEIWDVGDDMWVVHCANCGCSMDWLDSKAEAIKAWNRRADMKEKSIKKDLSWREKLEYIWCVLRFSKRMANWIVMNCEYCHHHEMERIGKPIESDVGNQKEFQQKYRCLHCGATGIVTQIWVKEG